MCGIFGVISDQKIVDIDALENISIQLKHRGPDDEGYLLFNADDEKAFKGPDSPVSLEIPRLGNDPGTFTGAFLHRRLSIIDLSDSGHQPMSYAGGRYWIILNGEIYNYLEIKNDLVKKGYTFHSTSDTEVVMAAYEEWGEPCVERFNGMWAFALYDKKEQKVFCSRDRFGVKPFYYTIASSEFIFCSELKGIRSHLRDKTSINNNKIREYLIRGELIIGADQETIFTEILQLMPGHNLSYDIRRSRFEIKRYWELRINMMKNHDLSFYIEGFKELFKDSIRLRLRSDVEVGSCLSGGLDSSSIVCLASKEFDKKMHTFSAIWPGSPFDESKYVKYVNDMTKSKGHSVTYYMEDFLALHDKIMWHQEIPIAGSSFFAQWLVMKESKQYGIKVLLDGQGADEILNGYRGYLYTYIIELAWNFKWNKIFTNRKSWNNQDLTYKSIAWVLLKTMKNRTTSWFPIIDAELKKYNSKDRNGLAFNYRFVPDFLKDHITMTNLPALLHSEDRNSMAHSVESRIPFLDFRLVEFCVNIPSEHKFNGALPKRILREAMKEFLPPEIYWRTDKIGFKTSIEEMIRNDQSLSEIMLSAIKQSDFLCLDWIDVSKIKTDQLFGLYSLARFIEIFKS